MAVITTTVFTTGFTGATDPGLVPNPFTATVETSGNTCRYGAAVGKSAGPGMRIDFAGTSADAYGGIEDQWSLYPANKIITLNMSVNFGILPFSGTTGTLALARLTAAAGQSINIRFHKPNSASNRFQLFDGEHNFSVTGTTAVAASTWYDLSLVLDATVGSESVKLYLNGVLEAQNGAAPGTYTRSMTRLRYGGMSVTGVPVALVNMSMDDLSMTIARTVLPPQNFSGSLGRIGNPQVGIPGVMF